MIDGPSGGDLEDDADDVADHLIEGPVHVEVDPHLPSVNGPNIIPRRTPESSGSNVIPRRARPESNGSNVIPRRARESSGSNVILGRARPGLKAVVPTSSRGGLVPKAVAPPSSRGGLADLGVSQPA